MRDEIHRYLIRAGGAVPAEKILKEVLRVVSSGTPAAARLLRAIIGDDPRFLEQDGAWRVTAGDAAPALPGLAALFIESARDSSGAGRMRGALSRGESTWAFEVGGDRNPAALGALAEAREAAAADLLVLWNAGSLRLWNRALQISRCRAWDGPGLRLASLASRALGWRGARFDASLLAARTALPAPDPEDPGGMARFLLDACKALLEKVPEEHRSSLDRLEQWIGKGTQRVDFSRFAFDRAYVDALPTSPGVYIMRNRAGDILYVGKARNLKRRVRSYFSPSGDADPKTARIREQLHSLEVVATTSEVEALLLETRLIRDFRPPINLQTEVHEQQAGYGRGRNLILIVPDEGGGSAELYFLRGNLFAGRLRARLGRPVTRRLAREVERIYYGPLPRRRRPDPREKEIVSRWLAANRDRVNFIDVDDAGGLETLCRWLRDFLSDPARLMAKTYYL